LTLQELDIALFAINEQISHIIGVNSTAIGMTVFKAKKKGMSDIWASLQKVEY